MIESLANSQLILLCSCIERIGSRYSSCPSHRPSISCTRLILRLVLNMLTEYEQAKEENDHRKFFALNLRSLMPLMLLVSTAGNGYQNIQWG
jgi:hypothetical protein